MARTGVLWMSPSYGYGGDLMYFAGVFRACAARMPGTRIAVAADFPVDRYPGLPLVPVLPAGVPGPAGPGAAYGGEVKARPGVRTVLGLLRTNAACFVTIEFTPLAVVTLLVAWARRRPSVLLIENHPRYRGGDTGRRALLVKGFLARRAGAVLTSGQEAADWIVEDLGVPRSRVRTGGYLTAVPDPAPRTTDPAPAVRRLLFVNSVTRRKGLAELLRAFARTRAVQEATVQLDVVGDGDDLDRCRALADELRVGGLVRFHGRLPYAELGSVYAAADLVVNPTLGDYRSLVGFEALLSERPVVLSRLDGASPELSRFGAVVTLVDPADEGRTAEVLDRALDGARAHPSGDPVWAEVREAYSFDAVAARVADAVAAAGGC